MSSYQFVMVMGLLAAIKGDTSARPVLKLLWSWMGTIAMGYAFFMEFIA